MAIFGAFYDANILYPSGLRNFLMHLALTGIFRAHWSAEVHDEWIRNLLKNRPDLTADKLDRTRQLMDKALPEAMLLGIAPSVLDPDEAGMGGNLPVKERLKVGVVAGGVKALCGIRATGKYFPLARHCRAYRVDVWMCG